MKKVLLVIIIICIILLIGLDVKIMWSIDEIKSNAEESGDLFQSQIDDLNKEKAKNEKVQEDEEDKTEIAEIPVGEVSKDKFKVCNEEESVSYEKEDVIQKYEELAKFEIENKKAYISIDAGNEIVQSIFEEVNEDSDYTLKSVNKVEITGFSAIPESVYIGNFGQDVSDQVAFFVMDDGTVEFLDLREALKNSPNYKSSGKLKDVSDIKKFDVLNVSDTEGGGYVTTVAIDQDGFYYDLNEILY